MSSLPFDNVGEAEGTLFCADAENERQKQKKNGSRIFFMVLKLESARKVVKIFFINKKNSQFYQQRQVI